MVSPIVYIWKKTPFLRILLPLIAGILLQWHLQVMAITWSILFGVSIVFLACLFTITIFYRFRLRWLDGVVVMLLFISTGALLAWYHDIRNDKKWFANYYAEGASMVVSLIEPPVQKTKSLKADAAVQYVIQEDKTITVKGRIILYFKIDSVSMGLDYGSQIIIHKSIQEIRNAGNPGGFDYKRYSLFRGITHQVYLKPGEFEMCGRKASKIKEFLYSIRQQLLTVFRKNIKGDRELGLSEALLIGYKDDLDQTLVQSYSNTGVVHVIAISGMHLALIYWLLTVLLRPLGKTKRWKWLKPVIALTILWLFSLLTGASASVLRAAVMFSFIVAADSLSRKTSIYNTLAASAFCLLCYNPYWLWDVGFQLSYAAVLSIVIFMKPVYNLFFVKNKLLDATWKLNSVTLAAQILTTPFSIYHFHQFPVYFFLTNLIAVPLSSAIVLGEILLCIISFLPPVALLAGAALTWLIRLMNNYVTRIEALPGSLWDGLQIGIVQSVFLFLLIAGVSFWLMERRRTGLMIGVIALLGFFVVRSLSFVAVNGQVRLIVYNVPQRRAIDLMAGRGCVFVGDQDLVTDDFIRNFHLKPSRVASRVSVVPALADLTLSGHYMDWKGKRIFLIDSSTSIHTHADRIDLDLVIISKNPRLTIPGLTGNFNIREIVFDGSVPFWKLVHWKKDCDSLHIPYHDVSEKGAFVMKLN